VAFGSDDIGLLFRAKGDTSDAKKAFNDLKGSITKDVGDIESKGTSGFSNLASSMLQGEGAASSLASAMPGVGTAIAAVVVAATAAVTVTIALTEKLFGLAESASEYGSKIHDAADQTGLSATTISALKYAADTSGSSLEKITGSVAKFSTLLGQAKDGNEKAEKVLKQYGITATDTDGALAQAVKTIASMTDSTQQSAAAAALFKDRTGEILPVIKSFDGDLPALMDKLQKMGLIMSDQDAAAADAFGDQMDTLKKQLQAAANTIGFAVMPVFMDFFTSLSNWISQNQVYIKAFALSIADAMNFVIAKVKEARNYILVMAAIAGGDYIKAGVLLGTGPGDVKAPHAEGAAVPSAPSFDPAKVTGGGKGGGGGRSKVADDAEKERQKALEDEINLLQLRLKQYEEKYKETLARIREEFKKNGNSDALGHAANDALTEFNRNTQAAVNDLNNAEVAKTGSLSQLLEAQQQERVDKLNKFITDEVDKTNKLVTDGAEARKATVLKIENDLTNKLKAVNRQRSDDFLKDLEDQWDTAISNEEGDLDKQNQVRMDAMLDIEQQLSNSHLAELQRISDEYDAEKAKIEKEVTDKDAQLKLLADLDELYKQKGLQSEEDYQKAKADIEAKYATLVTPGKNTFNPNDGFGEFEKAANAHLSGSKLTAAVGGIHMMESAFQQLAQAVGESVRSFVLFGSAGGGIKKFTATLIAELAKMAAVQAIWELAQGFAMLALNFFWPDPKLAASAAAHFHAAAIYGGMAVIASVAGRAVAGDSFKQDAAGAYGSAGGGASAQNRAAGGGSGAGGTVYSSLPDQEIDQGRNNPRSLGKLQVEVKINKDTGMLEYAQHQFNTNGPLRGMIVDVATAGA
jgi:hypothetical protein